MAKCEVCGNEYYLAFQVVAVGTTHTFDSFELYGTAHPTREILFAGYSYD